jgi:hypothetical protein
VFYGQSDSGLEIRQVLAWAERQTFSHCIVSDKIMFHFDRQYDCSFFLDSVFYYANLVNLHIVILVVQARCPSKLLKMKS